MKRILADSPRTQELAASIRKRLATDILFMFTPKMDEAGVNILDASLLQFFAMDQQLDIWELVRDVKVPVLRFRLLHKLILFSGTTIVLREDPSGYPDTLRLPDKAELAQMIEDLAK